MEILLQKADEHLMGKGKSYFILTLRLFTKKKEIVYNLVISDHHYILARKKLKQS